MPAQEWRTDNVQWLHLALALCLSIGSAWAQTSPAVRDGRLMLSGNDLAAPQPLILNGTWHFFAEQWIAPAAIETQAPHAGSALVPGARPGAVSAQRGIGTYWLEVIITDALRFPTSLQFQRLCGATAVYFFRAGERDVAPLLQVGRLNLDNTEIAAGNEQLVHLQPLQAGTYHLLIQQSSLQPRTGSLCGNVTWAPTSVQMHARILGVSKNTVVIALLLSLALGSLLLGSQNGERAAPWLALMCVTCALLIAVTSGLLSTLMPPDSGWLERLNHIGSKSALLWLPVAMLMVFRHTFAIALPRWFVFTAIATPLVLTLALIVRLDFFIQYPQPITITWCIELIVAYSALASACQRRRQYAWVALCASLPLLLATVFDTYRVFHDGRADIITPYAIALLIVVHGGIYTLKFGAAYQLAARLSAHLQEEVDLRTRELREKNHNLEQMQTALQRANETLKELSITDGLTRVYNRMYFEQQFDKEWRRCARQALPLSILMIDADNFKQLNDSAGHLVGDICLQMIAKQIENHFKRSGELVARYGGEEFIVLLPDTNHSKALAAAESLRTAIEQLPLDDDTGGTYRVTVSIGVSTTIPGIDQQPAQLIATADAALYEAKDSGRNRVHSIPIMSSRAALAQQKLHL